MKPTCLFLLLLFIPWAPTMAPGETLTERLAAKTAASAAKTPEPAKKVMMTSIARLRAERLGEKAPGIGDCLPDGTFLDASASSTTLYSQLGDGPAVIIFYRGGWCPYCNLQLLAYQEHLPEIEKLGAKLVAISPETPDQSAQTREKDKLSFVVLSDKGNTYARSLNIVFALDPDLKKLYQGFGVDLEKSQGTDAWELPLAAAFVVDAKHIVRYSFLDADYKKRADPETVLQELRNLNPASKTPR